jgi:parvulin-like peptidyl-prolyl isomerase
MAPTSHRGGLFAGRLVAAAVALTLAACLGEPAASPDAVARVAGEEIRYPRFEEYLQQNIGEAGSALPSEVLSQLFDQFLDEALLARLAADRHLAAAGTSPRQVAAALLADAAANWKPSDGAVTAYYAEHREDYARPERVHLRQILVEEKADAERALAAVRAGADFGDVARRLSQEPAAPMGGDQGELARGELPPAFADLIFNLKPGEVSGIVPTDYGFHLFQVLEHLPAQELPLADAAPEIRKLLARQANERRLDELVRDARDRYNPEVYERNLPFNYHGRYSAPPS